MTSHTHRLVGYAHQVMQPCSFIVLSHPHTCLLVSIKLLAIPDITSVFSIENDHDLGHMYTRSYLFNLRHHHAGL